MGHISNVTSPADGELIVVEVVESGASLATETVIGSTVPITGTIVRIDSILESGTATAIDPELYYQPPSTAPKPDSVKIASGIAGGPTVFSDASPVPYGRPGWGGNIVIKSQPNAGSDNVIRTRITVKGA